MRMNISFNEADLKKLIVEHIQKKYYFELKTTDINFEVKTSQNFKAEWEKGEMRSTVDIFKGDI